MKKFYDTIYNLSFIYLTVLCGNYFYIILIKGLENLYSISIGSWSLLTAAIALAIVVYRPIKKKVIKISHYISKELNKIVKNTKNRFNNKQTIR